MKVLKEDSAVAKKIRRVEDLLNAEGVLITSRGNGLVITLNNGEEQRSFVILDEGTKDPLHVFPSDFEPTHIQTIEDHIKGE